MSSPVAIQFLSRPVSPFPTAALPGSEEKIACMESRVSRGYQPTRPGDIDQRLVDEIAIDCDPGRNGRLLRQEEFRLMTALGRAEDEWEPDPLPQPKVMLKFLERCGVSIHGPHQPCPECGWTWRRSGHCSWCQFRFEEEEAS